MRADAHRQAHRAMLDSGYTRLEDAALYLGRSLTCLGGKVNSFGAECLAAGCTDTLAR